MVEVFKTNVESQTQANLLIDQIHERFPNYKANFDLDDCDKILRVKCIGGNVDSKFIIDLLNKSAFYAEVLADDKFELTATCLYVN